MKEPGSRLQGPNTQLRVPPHAPSPVRVDFTTNQGADLSVLEFHRVRDLLHRVCGIRLQDGKEQLVKARLWKRVRSLGLDGYSEYLDRVESSSGAEELVQMVDSLTTNKTSFFREPAHFEFLRDHIGEAIVSGRELRIWSAGCSTGQEPYTIAITMLEAAGRAPAPNPAAGSGGEFRVLATDISNRVLDEARRGRYPGSDLDGVDSSLVGRYFTRSNEGGRPAFTVADRVRRAVRFAKLNLMGEWPMHGPFDFIFCRNVMIYFDLATQQKLIRRFGEILRPGGHLLVGHSESLSGRAQGFTYVQPATYRK